MSSKTRIAVIGLGKMGLLHASLLNTLNNVEIVALCDKSAMIRKFCKKLIKKAQVIDDVEKLLGLDLDVVYVTTPISSHFSIAKTICSRGIAPNLFVEKTLATDYHKANELCRLAEASGGANMVGYMKRFAVTFKKAKSLLENDSLGDLISFDAYCYSSDFADAEKGSNVSESRGGVLSDLGSHAIDLALWFFGDLKTYSTEGQSVGTIGSEDSVCFSVKKPDGLVGRFDISWRKDGYRLPETGFTIRGSKGVITVNDDRLKLELSNGESKRWLRHDLNDGVAFLLGAPEYFREDDFFIRSVQVGKKAEPSFYTASKVDWIIDQARLKAGKDE